MVDLAVGAFTFTHLHLEFKDWLIHRYPCLSKRMPNMSLLRTLGGALNYSRTNWLQINRCAHFNFRSAYLLIAGPLACRTRRTSPI
jgi:hypothetical protein